MELIISEDRSPHYAQLHGLVGEIVQFAVTLRYMQ